MSEQLEMANGKLSGRAVIYSSPLVIRAEDVRGVFGPKDMVGEIPRLMFAAEIVAGWATANRKAEEFARRFCSQWPDGPQVAERRAA